MSHYIVLVFGDNVEEQLAPFHEFECTGVDDQYVVDVDITEKVRTEYRLEGEDLLLRDAEVPPFVTWCEANYGYKTLDYGASRTADHACGFIELDEDGSVVRVVKHTNPNKKWDWYCVGGRWRGYFRVKPGSDAALGKPSWTNEGEKPDPNTADCARVCDLDIEAERARLEAKARELHGVWMTVVREYGMPESWETIRDRLDPDIAAAREAYQAQPAIVALRKSEAPDGPLHDLKWMTITGDESVLGDDVEAYVQRHRAGAFVPYAYVYEGRWVARGEMGWFACSHDEPGTLDQWRAHFADFLAKVPPETFVTAIDCHI